MWRLVQTVAVKWSMSFSAKGKVENVVTQLFKSCSQSLRGGQVNEFRRLMRQGGIAVVGVAARSYFCFSPGLFNLFLIHRMSCKPGRCLCSRRCRNLQSWRMEWGSNRWAESQRCVKTPTVVLLLAEILCAKAFGKVQRKLKYFFSFHGNTLIVFKEAACRPAGESC